MKVAVLNYSGNVGKSTLARHLLQPRLDNCPITFVESINEGGDETNVRGRDFATVMVKVLASEQAIVDIGSSNIEQVFAKVRGMGDVLEDFDFFLIPTTAKAKQQADTIKIIRDLIALDVPSTKLKVVFNHADPEESADKQFAGVKNVIDALGIASAIVHENDGYAHLGTRTIKECRAEGRDFRAEIAAASTKEAKHDMAVAQVFSRLAQSIQHELDGVFLTLFGQRP